MQSIGEVSVHMECIVSRQNCLCAKSGNLWFFGRFGGKGGRGAIPSNWVKKGWDEPLPAKWHRSR